MRYGAGSTSVAADTEVIMRPQVPGLQVVQMRTKKIWLKLNQREENQMTESHIPGQTTATAQRPAQDFGRPIDLLDLAAEGKALMGEAGITPVTARPRP
jgi:hypothetical protein